MHYSTKIIERIKELSDIENIFETDQMQDNLEHIHNLIKLLEEENKNILKNNKKQDIITNCVVVLSNNK
jgi:hypothetical protein